MKAPLVAALLAGTCFSTSTKGPNGEDPRDVTGNYDVTYDNQLTLKLNIGGAERVVTQSGYGGIADFGVYQGQPVQIDMTQFCARPDVQCVLHTHTVAGIAVSSQADGLLPIAQTSMRFYNRVAYHDFEGISLDTDERSRLIADLGDKYAMILRNHGLLVAGRTVAEAWSLIFSLEKSCQAQLAALAGGVKLHPVPPEVCEKTAQQMWRSNEPGGKLAWPAYLRLLDKLDPSYKQ